MSKLVALSRDLRPGDTAPSEAAAKERFVDSWDRGRGVAPATAGAVAGRALDALGAQRVTLPQEYAVLVFSPSSLAASVMLPVRSIVAWNCSLSASVYVCWRVAPELFAQFWQVLLFSPASWAARAPEPTRAKAAKKSSRWDAVRARHRLFPGPPDEGPEPSLAGVSFSVETQSPHADSMVVATPDYSGVLQRSLELAHAAVFTAASGQFSRRQVGSFHGR